MDRLEVRIAGSGGQGVVLAGVVLAEAAVLAGLNALQSQAYGPQSRGGASRSDVIITGGPVPFPCADRVDVLVALTQAAADAYRSTLKTDGLLLVDTDAVVPPSGPWRCRSLPLERTAAAAGGRQAANMVGLGALARLTGAVALEDLEKVLAVRLKGSTLEVNRRALAAGANLAQEGSAARA